MPDVQAAFTCQRCGISIRQKRRDRIPTYCASTCVGPKRPKWDRSPRTCEHCRGTYTPNAINQRWCGRVCHKLASNEAERRNKYVTCWRCGSVFENPPGLGSGQRKFCPGTCSEVPREAPRKPCRINGCDRLGIGRDICDSHRNQLRFSKPCLRCGEYGQRDGELCLRCKNLPLHIGEVCWVRWLACDICGSDYQVKGKAPRRHCYPHTTRTGQPSYYLPVVAHDIECRRCGQTFVGKWRRYCDPCSAAQRKMFRKLRKWKTRIDLQALAERDGQRCHLCGKRVRWDVHSLHDLYPSRDHLIPRSVKGSHDLANIALAHRICNSRRGAKGNVQLRLIA